MEYNKLSSTGQDPDSVELESLVSSDDLGSGSRASVSSRGLSDDSPPHFDNSIELDRRGGHTRSLSVSTLGDHMFQLTATRDFASAGVPLEKQKRLNLMHGLSFVIGLIIGSGIFASPGQVNAHAGSIGGALIIWVVSGVLAWTGASSYAELGTAIPLNGSSQAYLNHIFGPFASFLFSWTALTVLKPGGTAIIAIVFSEYLTKSMGIAFLENYWMQKLIAIIGLAAVTGLNCYSTKLGANVNSLFMVTKVALLIAIAIIGAVAFPHFKDHNALSEGLWKPLSDVDVGDYAIALYAGLWAYDGWDNMNYVAAEMKSARRDLPRTIHISMPVVIIAYVFANISYFAILSNEEIFGSNTVAIKFASTIFGSAGGIAFGVLIAASCIGALNATVFSSARLVYSSAEEEFLPSMFCKIHPTRGTPVNAMIFQAATTCFFIIVGEFHNLITFYGIAGYLFYFLTVFGVIVLRIKEPNLDRSYKTWITTPILFCCVALFLVSRTVVEKPLESLFAGLFIIAGVPIFVWRFGSPVSVSSVLQLLRLRK